MANGEEPAENPNRSDGADHEEGQPPGARPADEREHDERGDDRPERGSALEDAVAQGTLVCPQNPLSRSQRARPVPRLEHAQGEPAGHQR